MITFKQFLQDEVRKNIWTHLSSKDKEDYSSDLLDIVGNAYKNTSLGAFVKSIVDVKGSEWIALDYDPEEDIDTAVFYRLPRANEKWVGKKVQGIGHDGQSASKEKLMKKLVDLLNSGGWWIEASEALAKSLKKKGAYNERDEDLLKEIFPSIVKFHEDGSYDRKIDGKIHNEFVFGHVK